MINGTFMDTIDTGLLLWSKGEPVKVLGSVDLSQTSVNGSVSRLSLKVRWFNEEVTERGQEVWPEIA